MSIINRVAELNKHGMACSNCETKMAEVFIDLNSGSGLTGYSYCKDCAYNLAISILIDCDKLGLDEDTY